MKGHIQIDKLKDVCIDRDARSIYFTLSHNPVVKTVRHSEEKIVDYDKEGRIVGVELICLKAAYVKLAIKKTVEDIRSLAPGKLEGSFV